LSIDRQTANPRDSRGSINQAREAAEALFKPRPSQLPIKTPTTAPSGAAASEQPVRRQPRIFTTTPDAMIGEDQSEAPVISKRKARRTSNTREAETITRSDYGRIRALVHYGMTTEQVADLYGVPISRIERIVRAM
jgi:hypothetical protein